MSHPEMKAPGRHGDDDADVRLVDLRRSQEYAVPTLEQSGAASNEGPAVSQSVSQEADHTETTMHGAQDDSEPQKGLHLGEDDARPSSVTPQHQTSPSEDVSLNLNIGGGQQEDEMEMQMRRQDDTGVEERRVVFLPPPRVSPVFVPPRSSYPVGPPPIGSAYGTPPMGQIGVHYPREIIRIERDYSGGDLIQFYSIYPIELEGRITPTQWLDTVNGINEILLSAHSLRRAAVDHVLAVFSLYLTSLILTSHYEKEMRRLRTFIDQCNEQLYHSQGLNILWPKPNGFLFMEIEYYVCHNSPSIPHLLTTD